jgi:FkbM family methyltransferase
MAKKARKVIPKLAEYLSIDLLRLAHNEIGILLHPKKNGEQYLASVWLPSFLERNGVSDPLLLDVGANVGKYSAMLLEEFPEARLQAFEPHPQAFEKCRKKLKSYFRVNVENIAIGPEKFKLKLYIPGDEEKSALSSLHVEVLREQHDYTKVHSHNADVEKLDCLLDREKEVHFVKFDTEGHEYDALKGAEQAIEEGRIWAVQFEFNEMNVISRIFLRDYFKMLNDYKLFRMFIDHLEPIEYDPRQEILQLQNILAIHKSKRPPGSH